MYKNTKPASQFILYIPIHQIGPNLVSLIWKSEFHLQAAFCHKAPYSSHCNGYQNLWKIAEIATAIFNSIETEKVVY